MGTQLGRRSHAPRAVVGGGNPPDYSTLVDADGRQARGGAQSVTYLCEKSASLYLCCTSRIPPVLGILPRRFWGFPCRACPCPGSSRHPAATSERSRVGRPAGPAHHIDNFVAPEIMDHVCVYLYVCTYTQSALCLIGSGLGTASGQGTWIWARI